MIGCSLCHIHICYSARTVSLIRPQKPSIAYHPLCNFRAKGDLLTLYRYEDTKRSRACPRGGKIELNAGELKKGGGRLEIRDFRAKVRNHRLESRSLGLENRSSVFEVRGSGLEAD